MRIVLRALVTALGVAALVHGTAHAATSAGGSTTGAQLLEQKRGMVERLLVDSPVVKRIGESGHAEAQRHLALARDLHRNAAMLLRDGREVSADAMLNEAMWQISRARQLVPDPLAQAVEERVRYGQLQESIAAVRASVGANASHDRIRTTGTAGNDKASSLVANARIAAEGERFNEANRLLDEALTLMLQEWQRQHGGRAVVYSRNFSRPEDEYAFELERNRSYETLIPVAITEFRPGPDLVAQIDRLVEQNKSLRARAEREAVARNLKSAVQALQGGTDALQKALQTAGLALPQHLD